MTAVAVAAAPADALERRRLRRISVIWALLFFDVLGDSKSPVLHIPHRIAQAMTQGALVAALLLVLTVNPKLKIRPNLFLGVYSVLAMTTLMTSVRLVSIGTTYRAFRLILFLAVLWLLTPWFGRRDLLLVRAHVRILIVVFMSALIGLGVSPHNAYVEHRLTGAIWPIPPTQVAHYAAEMIGLLILLWLCGLMKSRRTLILVSLGLVALILTHTRTALVAASIGLFVAGLSLFTANRRVRNTFGVVLVVSAIVAAGPSAFFTSWLARGQSAKQIQDLTGRTKAWNLVLSNPRPETNKLFGSGLSNGGVYYQADPAKDGLSIDSSWIATYQDQGLVGDVLDGAILLTLVVTAATRRRSPERALAVFLVVYCAFASYTETGLGLASPYLLDLAAAASLLAAPPPDELAAPRLIEMG